MEKVEIENQGKQIVEEGKRLYRSEMASWLGTDIFCKKLNRRNELGGYLSYEDGDTVKCIIFSKKESPGVIAAISFDKRFNSVDVDPSKRVFTQSELDLFTIRTIAIKTIKSDPFFIFYPNTNPNLIPLESNGEKKVCVLTGPMEAGVLIFGNDYLLTFDYENKLIDQKRIHQNIIVDDLKREIEDIPKGARLVAGQHTHLPETGDLITATDICTLMLYGKLMGLERYYVSSESYISVWNCLTDQLTIQYEGLET